MYPVHLGGPDWRCRKASHMWAGCWRFYMHVWGEFILSELSGLASQPLGLGWTIQYTPGRFSAWAGISSLCHSRCSPTHHQKLGVEPTVVCSHGNHALCTPYLLLSPTPLFFVPTAPRVPRGGPMSHFPAISVVPEIQLSATNGTCPMVTQKKLQSPRM